MERLLWISVFLVYVTAPVVAMNSHCLDITCASDICEYGHKRDHNDCPLCDCLDAPCANTVCDLDCPYGLEIDQDGCPICECQQDCGVPPTCDPCEYGYTPDEQGCPTCGCDAPPPSCPELQCESSCPDGRLEDEDGCPTCECEPWTACAVTACENGGTCLAYGTGLDETALCVCKPGFYGHYCQIPGDTACEPEWCALHCDHGLQRDEMGCEVCRCLEEPRACEPPRCLLLCQHALVRDTNGCEVCVCMSNPDPRPCPDIASTCLLHCDRGNKVDARGCDVCECNGPGTDNGTSTLTPASPTPAGSIGDETQSNLFVVGIGVLAALLLLALVALVVVCCRRRRSSHGFYSGNKMQGVTNELYGKESVYAISTEKQNANLVKFDQLG